MAAIWMSVSLGFLPAFGFGTLRNGKAFSRSLRTGKIRLHSLYSIYMKVEKVAHLARIRLTEEEK